MTQQEAEVYMALKKYGPRSGHGLARWLDIPQPSVRRIIQQLRAAGHNITFATGRDATYTLHISEEPAPVEAPSDDSTQEQA